MKRRMRSFPHINWSEVARHALEERLHLEERLQERTLDVDALNRAITIQDTVRAQSTGQWSLSREITKWRNRRR